MLDGFGIRYVDIADELAGQIRFALRHNAQGYDAAYLAVAMGLEARLATLDRGLRSAARSAGIDVFA